MLHLAHKVRGTSVHAADGTVGTLADFLFEQPRWAIRYLVVNTGSWLKERQVLVSPMAVQAPWDREGIRLSTTRAQIETSPDLRPAALVRASETTLLQHYGHPVYWEGASVWGMFETPGALLEAGPAPRPREATAGGLVTDPLRSTEEIKGYHIQAADGEIGHVDDFLIGETSWRIRYLVVDTSNWIGGTSVLVGTDVVHTVDREHGRLRVSDRREDIRNSPTYASIVGTLDPAETGPPFLFI